jgi:hypothetical protein
MLRNEAAPSHLNPGIRAVTDMIDDLSGNGVVLIAGEEVGVVFYWLTMAEEPGPVVAEGSISSTEELMLQIYQAEEAQLRLEDGPIVRLVCEGGSSGTRWVKTMAIDRAASSLQSATDESRNQE